MRSLEGHGIKKNNIQNFKEDLMKMINKFIFQII